MIPPYQPQMGRIGYAPATGQAAITQQEWRRRMAQASIKNPSLIGNKSTVFYNSRRAARNATAQNQAGTLIGQNVAPNYNY